MQGRPDARRVPTHDSYPKAASTGAATIAALIVINVPYGLFSQCVDIAVTSVRQAITPLAIQGRVVATINFLGLGLTPVGALVGGAAASTFGIRTALVVTTAGRLSPLARIGRSLTR